MCLSAQQAQSQSTFVNITSQPSIAHTPACCAMPCCDVLCSDAPVAQQFSDVGHSMLTMFTYALGGVDLDIMLGSSNPEASIVL